MSFPRIARRLALAGTAATAAAIALTPSQRADSQVLRGHNTNAPVDFDADRIEVQDRADRVVVSGHVQVTQGDMHLTSDRLTVAYTRGDGVEINRMDALGHVVVTRGNETAKGDTAIYDLNRKIITMVGNVKLTRGTDHLSGPRIVIDLANGQSSIGSGGSTADGIQQSGGRVSGTFKVKQN